MSDYPLTSVIVPVYKVERYIRHTVSSIMDQNYKNLEIILVDDGSPDSCPAILDEFAALDDRIRVIHQANSGVSAARNAGLSAAVGEYIMFVDGDDWVEDSYVSYNVGLLKKTGCDVGMSTCFFGDAGAQLNQERVVTSEKAIEWIYLDTINVAVWNKIYKADLIKSVGLSFNTDIWYGEGMLFNIEALQLVDRVAIGGRPVYHQVFNPNSAMRDFNLESNLCGLRSLDLQRESWRKQAPSIEAAWQYHRYCYNKSIISGLVRTGAVPSNRTLYRSCIKSLRRGASIPLRMAQGLSARLKWVLWIVAPSLSAGIAAARFNKKARAQTGSS